MDGGVLAFSLWEFHPDAVEHIRIIEALEDCGGVWNEVCPGIPSILVRNYGELSGYLFPPFLSAQRTDTRQGIFTGLLF